MSKRCQIVNLECGKLPVYFSDLHPVSLFVTSIQCHSYDIGYLHMDTLDIRIRLGLTKGVC